MQILRSIRLPAHLENLHRLIESVSECARTQGFDPKQIGEIELATEEVFVNICQYAYPDKPGEVEMNCKLDKDHFIIEIIDWGGAFDMTSLPLPDLTGDVDRRKAGGLGVFLTKEFMDEVRYYREHDRNILNLIVKKEKG